MSAETCYLGGLQFVVVPHADASNLGQPGLYAFARRDHLWFEALYIGKAANLSDRARPWHEKWAEARQAGMDALLVSIVRSEADRRLIEERLITVLAPPLNKQHNDIHPDSYVARLGALEPAPPPSWLGTTRLGVRRALEEYESELPLGDWWRR